MDSEHMQNRLTEIQGHIDNFERKLINSKNSYQRALELLTDLELRSKLIEQHVIHTERQRSAIAKMEGLYRQVQGMLASTNGHNS